MRLRKKSRSNVAEIDHLQPNESLLDSLFGTTLEIEEESLRREAEARAERASHESEITVQLPLVEDDWGPKGPYSI